MPVPAYTSTQYWPHCSLSHWVQVTFQKWQANLMVKSATYMYMYIMVRTYTCVLLVWTSCWKGLSGSIVSNSCECLLVDSVPVWSNQFSTGFFNMVLLYSEMHIMITVFTECVHFYSRYNSEVLMQIKAQIAPPKCKVKVCVHFCTCMVYTH